MPPLQDDPDLIFNLSGKLMYGGRLTTGLSVSTAEDRDMSFAIAQKEEPFAILTERTVETQHNNA